MKILDRYVSGQVLGTVTWAISLLTMILVLGNVLRDLLSLLHQPSGPGHLHSDFHRLSASVFNDLLDSLGGPGGGSPGLRQTVFGQ